MKEIMKLGFVLLLVCAIAATALGFTNELTKDRIQENIDEANRLARQEVFEAAENFTLLGARSDFEDIEDSRVKTLIDDNKMIDDIYAAYDKNDTLLGYVMTTQPEGYGGKIAVILGFSLDGTITGVRIANHAETPGLGAKAATETFYNQYMDLKADGNIRVIKEKVQSGDNAIQAITSATITSDAVTDGVNLSKLVLDALK